MTDQGSDPAAIADAVGVTLWARDTASRQMGMELVEIAPGLARVRMRVREDMTNGHQFGHGGYTFALADTALAFASNSHGELALTASATIEFLNPARLGHVLMATAREQSRGGRTGISDVRVENQQGELAALFRGCSARLKDVRILGNGPSGA